MAGDRSRPGRPPLARLVQLGVLALRVWALPFLLLGWALGALAQAFVLGLAVGWEIPGLDLVSNIYLGKPGSGGQKRPKLQEPVECDDIEDIEDLDID